MLLWTPNGFEPWMDGESRGGMVTVELCVGQHDQQVKLFLGVFRSFGVINDRTHPVRLFDMSNFNPTNVYLKEQHGRHGVMIDVHGPGSIWLTSSLQMRDRLQQAIAEAMAAFTVRRYMARVRGGT